MDKPVLQPIAIDSHSKAMLITALKAARSTATVLITGETGAGKEVIAQYIHQHSAHAHGPFISVNCAALPDNMIEAILFGYEKGSFTGAINQYVGKFEQANTGTLLLDEISELSISLQAKLLRALQEREIERLGGKRLIPINVRIIAATNRNLQEQVDAGLFRKDLFYRLNVIPLYCHPLRERKEDILPLAEYFITKYKDLSAQPQAVTLSNCAKQKLLEHNWPGNVREMDNLIQRILVMSEQSLITAEDIDLPQMMKPVYILEPILDNTQFESKLAASEAKAILEVLGETAGSRAETAKKLNISPRTLRYKLAKLRANGVKVP